MSTAVFYFRLAALCLRLSLNLFVFSLELIGLKINKKALFVGLLLALIIASLATNFFLWQEKNTAKIVIIPLALDETHKTDDLKFEKRVLRAELVMQEESNLQEIRKQIGQNKALLLNLGQLNKILNKESETNTYLLKAEKI